MTLKRILGLILLVVYGFAVFLCCASLGVAATLVVTTLPWWEILIGTLLGTIAVVMHYIVKWEMEDKKK